MVGTPKKSSAKGQPWLSRKRLFQIHAWLGMSFGSLLFIICFSGALAALSHEIDWVLNPAIRSWPAANQKMTSWNSWALAVQNSKPDWRVRWISAPPNPYSAVEVIADSPHAPMRRVYINPYTSEIQGGSSYFNVQRFLRDFHRMLNISGPGLYIVTFFSFPLLFSVISGLLFYKNWRRNLFQLRLTKGAKAFWSDLHRLIGVWSFVFAVLISITGIWYMVEFTPLVKKLVPPEKSVLISQEKLQAAGHTPAMMNLDEIIRKSQEAFPDLRIRTVWFPTSANDPFRIEGQASTWLVRDRANQVWVNPHDGSIIDLQRAESLSPLRRWEDTADPLHFGDFGGIFTKIIWSIFGIALPVLVLSGAYLSMRQVKGNTPPSLKLQENWWHIHRWTVWTWIGLIIISASFYYSIPAITRYALSPVSAYSIQNDIRVGPWIVTPEISSNSLRLRMPCSGCIANFQSISLSLTHRNGKSEAATPLKPIGHYWTLNSKSFRADSVEKAEVLITDWSKSTYSGTILLNHQKIPPIKPHQPDDGPLTGNGTWFFVAPLILLMIVISLFWAARFGSWRV